MYGSMKKSDYEHFDQALKDCFGSNHKTFNEFFNIRRQTLNLLNRMMAIYPEDSEKFLDEWEMARDKFKERQAIERGRNEEQAV